MADVLNIEVLRNFLAIQYNFMNFCMLINGSVRAVFEGACR
jgi:hypothetical protein